MGFFATVILQISCSFYAISPVHQGSHVYAREDSFQVEAHLIDDPS